MSESTNPTGWISVNDSLPGVYETVLISVRCYGKTEARVGWITHYYHNGDQIWQSVSRDGILGEVYAWMPLTEPAEYRRKEEPQ